MGLDGDQNWIADIAFAGEYGRDLLEPHRAGPTEADQVYFDLFNGSS